MGYAPTKIMYTANRTNPRATTNPIYLPIMPFNTPAPTGRLLYGRDGNLLLGPYASYRAKYDPTTPRVRVWSSGGAHYDVILVNFNAYILYFIHVLTYYAELQVGGDQRSECEYVSDFLLPGAPSGLPYLIRPKATERAGDETWWLDYGVFYYKSNVTGVAGQSPVGTYDWHSGYVPGSGANGYDTAFARSSWAGGLDPTKNDWYGGTPFPQVEIEAYLWSVLYSANGATSGSAPAEQQKIIGTTLVLATNSGSLAKTGKTFSGWNTAADGSGTDYATSANYTTDNYLILYAKWT